MKNNTNLIFMRHGITDLNLKNVYFGYLDPPLNNTGKEQIENTKKLFLNKQIDVIYSSDLKRCTESADIVNELYHLEIFEKKNLRELNFGIFEGKSFDDITLEYPDEAEMFFKNWQNYRIPKGESIKEFMKRISFEIENIKHKHNGKNILIVTHSGVIQSVLSYYFSKNLDFYWKFMLNNASITKLCFDKNDFSFLEYVNRI